MPGEGPGRRARRALQGAAVCEAASRPHVNFVPVKSIEQQSMLCMHRLREGLKADRTAYINRIRGLLAERHPCATATRFVIPTLCRKPERTFGA